MAGLGTGDGSAGKVSTAQAGRSVAAPRLKLRCRGTHTSDPRAGAGGSGDPGDLTVNYSL